MPSKTAGLPAVRDVGTAGAVAAMARIVLEVAPGAFVGRVQKLAFGGAFRRCRRRARRAATVLSMAKSPQALRSAKALRDLVGGGPAPGINAVIAAATIKRSRGLLVLGCHDGYHWLMQRDLGHVEKLEITSLEDPLRRGLGSPHLAREPGEIDRDARKRR